ncbi:methyltransferase [Candidatus Gottesmanbacteria bacterium]|nr:methyltransferase [Candidatus Gottesmanbacteria bacterium]
MSETAINVIGHIVGSDAEYLRLSINTQIISLAEIIDLLRNVADQYHFEESVNGNDADQKILTAVFGIGKAKIAVELIDQLQNSSMGHERIAVQTGESYLPQRAFSAAERQQWRRNIFRIYDRMKARSASGLYETRCSGLSITVLPNVYAPGFFTDTQWFAKELPPVINGGQLLEIGTGTGIISILCALNGARVVATDINLYAVENARLNIARHHLDISVRHGNLYDPIKANEKFDFIFWAHPFNNWETPVADMLLRSGMDYQYEGLKGYIVGAKDHLSRNGKLLLGTGDSADLKTIHAVAEDNGYGMKLLKETEMPLEDEGTTLIKYLIYEFVHRNS